MESVYINTATAFSGRLTGVLYRTGGVYSATIYARNHRNKTVKVAGIEGTRTECVKFRNTALRNSALLTFR